MPVPETLKRTIGYGRCIRLRELAGGNPIYNAAYDHYRTIFIHIPKTAGTSIGETLFPGHRSTHYRWDHYCSYDQVKFERYFKFTFVRNPYDRLVSAFVYLQQGGKSATPQDKQFHARHLAQYSSFKDFVCRGLKKPVIQRWGHFAPQSSFIASPDGKVRVDFVGRVEHLAEDFRKVAKRLGIEATLSHVNATKRKHYSEYFDDESEAIAFEVYQQDFRLFQYARSAKATIPPVSDQSISETLPVSGN